MEDLERRAAESDVPGVAFVTEDEWYAMFDEAVRAELDIRGEEFIERWNAGEWADVWDTAGYRHIGFLAGLIPSVVAQNT
jgi:hypothetical protein